MAAKSKSDVAQVTQQLYNLLEPLESQDRMKAVAATLTLLGESEVPAGGTPPSSGGPLDDSPPIGGAGFGGGGGNITNVRQFFDWKDPRTKAEELAVAARYRELYENAQQHERGELVDAIKAARRDPPTNYPRDLKSAKNAGFFTRGSDKTLAAYGQNYVDTLPDREAAKELRAPRAGRKKVAKKKSVGKKKSAAKKASSKKKTTTTGA